MRGTTKTSRGRSSEDSPVPPRGTANSPADIAATPETLPFVSIVIAVAADNPNLRQSLEHCSKLDYPNFEVIVLPDEGGMQVSDARVRIEPTGKVGPGEKRDRGTHLARGSIIAFLDDDAYPTPNYLRAAARLFEDPQVAAAGGPAVTPPEDDWLQEASGWVYASPVSGGHYAYRYLPRPQRDVDDYPSCNLLVRKQDFLAVGGFDTRYWPGEDTILCLKLTHELGKRLVYHPDVLVYHHRRRLFLPHLRQVWNYALHRGFFVKKFPQTSLRWAYFVPSLFLLFLVIGAVVSLLVPSFAPVYGGVLATYLCAVAAGVLWTGRPKLFPTVFLGIVLTHLFYGAFFLRGLAAKNLAR